MRYLILTLALIAGPTHAYTANDCDSMQELIEAAMEFRLNGVPAQEAIRGPDLGPDFRKAWAKLVAEVYRLDRRILTGSERADLLTQFYVQCLGTDPDA